MLLSTTASARCGYCTTCMQPKLDRQIKTGIGAEKIGVLAFEAMKLLSNQEVQGWDLWPGHSKTGFSPKGNLRLSHMK